MAYNGTSWTVLVVVISCICHQIVSSVKVLQEEQSASIYCLSFSLCQAKFRVVIALDSPIITLITEAIITVASNLLTIGERGFEARVGVEILSSAVVLKSDFISTFDRFTCSAHFAIDKESITFFDSPDAIVTISCSYSCDNLLTTSSTEIDSLAVYTIVIFR